MHTSRNIHKKMIGLTLALACSAVWAAETQDTQVRRETHPVSISETSVADANNTAINDRDDNDAAITSQTQSNDAADIELLSSIRQQIVEEDTLSSSAHNIKIMTNKGTVTLRGPVNSAMEKDKVGKLVEKITGVASIDNQLDVTSTH